MNENRKKQFEQKQRQIAKKAEWADIDKHGASKKAQRYYNQFVKPKGENGDRQRVPTAGVQDQPEDKTPDETKG